MSYSIAINSQFNSLEVSFTEKPTETIREALKKLKFRWNPKKSVWYGFSEKETLEKVLSGEKVESKTEKKEKAVSFDYDVKVGDLFVASWGYEQTNLNFFQVIKLVGKKSVRVVEVQPKMIKEEATCGMAADRSFENTKELLQIKENSIFIDDSVNGDLKRIKSYSADGKSDPLFEVGKGGYFCHKYNGEALYESWYY